MTIAFRIGADLKMNEGKCRMAVSNPIFHTQSFSVALPKNSRFTKAVNREYINISYCIVYVLAIIYNCV